MHTDEVLASDLEGIKKLITREFLAHPNIYLPQGSGKYLIAPWARAVLKTVKERCPEFSGAQRMDVLHEMDRVLQRAQRRSPRSRPSPDTH